MEGECHRSSSQFNRTMKRNVSFSALISISKYSKPRRVYNTGEKNGSLDTLSRKETGTHRTESPRSECAAREGRRDGFARTRWKKDGMVTTVDMGDGTVRSGVQPHPPQPHVERRSAGTHPRTRGTSHCPNKGIGYNNKNKNKNKNKNTKFLRLSYIYYHHHQYQQQLPQQSLS